MSRAWCQALFSGAQQQDKNNDHKLNHKKFHLNMRKKFFTLRIAKHWNRLPRQVVESPSLEILKTHQDTFLCDLL